MQHQDRIPRIAIIDPNTLAVLGLKHILQSLMPMMQVDAYGSFAELSANHPEQYYHYFADTRVVLGNMAFFAANRHKTIVAHTTGFRGVGSGRLSFHLRVTAGEASCALHTRIGTACPCKRAQPAADPCRARVSRKPAHKAGGRGYDPRRKGIYEQAGCRYAEHKYPHRSDPPEKRDGQTRNEERVGTYHLCRDARLCGCGRHIVGKISANCNKTAQHFSFYLKCITFAGVLSDDWQCTSNFFYEKAINNRIYAASFYSRTMCDRVGAAS